MKEAPFLVFFVLLATSQGKPQGGYSYPQHQQQLQLPQHTNQIPAVPQQDNLNGNFPQIVPQGPSLPAAVVSQAYLPQANVVPYNPQLQQSTLQLLPVTQQINFNQHKQGQPIFLPAPGTQLLPQQEHFAVSSQLVQEQPQVAQLDISQLPIQPNQILIPNLQAPQVQQGFNAPAVAQPQQFALPEAEPTVTKDIYVHVAPEEPPQNILPASPPKKHYKIIFIKTPSQTIRPVPSQAVQEKTFIYVLVKKPEQEKVVVHQPAPVQPSKPEVYFVKYKAKPGGTDAVLGAVNSQFVADNNNPKNEENRVRLINSGESTSSLISGGLPAQSTKYGPPGYQKTNA